MCATQAVALPAFIAAFNNSVFGGKRQKGEGKDVVKSSTQQRRHTAAAEGQRVQALILTFIFGASCRERSAPQQIIGFILWRSLFNYWVLVAEA